MNPNEDYKPRITFEITEEQQQRMNKLLNTYGIRKAILGHILDDLLNLIEKHGNIIIGIILDGPTRPREIMPLLNRAERKANGDN